MYTHTTVDEICFLLYTAIVQRCHHCKSINLFCWALNVCSCVEQGKCIGVEACLQQRTISTTYTYSIRLDVNFACCQYFSSNWSCTLAVPVHRRLEHVAFNLCFANKTWLYSCVSRHLPLHSAFILKIIPQTVISSQSFNRRETWNCQLQMLNVKCREHFVWRLSYSKRYYEGRPWEQQETDAW